MGMAGPLTVAFGAEYRKETWEAAPGDEASRYLEGGQSFPGISTSDSGSHDRNVVRDTSTSCSKPIDKLSLDLAGRYEDYSDFGDTTVGKLSARYEFTDAFALRGTVSTGFRAPTLAEEFYSATNVGPTTAFVQMPPNAPATGLLGLGAGLQPEKSTNYSLGFVLRPDHAMSLTFDLYQVEVRNRIAATSTFYGTINGKLHSQVIVDAIIANGNVLDPEVTAKGDTGINLFTNGVTTRTRGADLSFDFASEFDALKIDWSVAATYTQTDVTKVRATPAEFGTTQPLFDQVAISDLEDTAPKYLVNLGANLRWDRLSHQRARIGLRPVLRVRERRRRHQRQHHVLQDRDRHHAHHQPGMSVPGHGRVMFTVGATNVFDEKPDKRNDALRARSSPPATTAWWPAIRRSRRSASTALTTTASSTSASERRVQDRGKVGEQRTAAHFSRRACTRGSSFHRARMGLHCRVCSGRYGAPEGITLSRLRASSRPQRRSRR